MDRGEFAFLTGPSGSGKTTLLRILIGEEKPSAGQVVVAGKDVTAMNEKEVALMRRSIGFVFQDFKLLPHKTALDNVALVLRISGLSHGEQRLRAVRAIRRVGLEHRTHYYPEMLSGGEQQRIAIARAVVNDPDLLLADEPTGNLDPELTVDIMTIFRDINARGTTVVVATHDPTLMADTHRRQVLLAAGRGTEVRPPVGTHEAPEPEPAAHAAAPGPRGSVP